MRRSAGLVVSFLFVFSPISPAISAVRYVDQNASGGNNGTSWADAYTDLQSALAVAVSGDQVWVAEGTYRPTSGTNRNIRFTLIGGISLYGGFAGGEVLLSQRNWDANPTILSGDIGAPGVASDNTQIVVYKPYALGGIVLDGFIVEDGRTDIANGGGGVNCSGPGILRNLVVRHNYAAYGGGGVVVDGHADQDTVRIENCVIAGNAAGSRGGGLWTTFNPHALMTNVWFFNNGAPVGAGCYLDRGSTGTNLTFVGNTGGSAVHGDNGDFIYSCIVWGNGGFPHTRNVTVSHSLVQNSGGSTLWNSAFGIDAGGNVDTDPLFVDTQGGDHHLSLTSPARNAGTNSAPFQLAIDLDGLTRVHEGTVDMGAFEFHCPPDSIVRVRSTATGSPTGASWSDAFSTVQHALSCACENVHEIWVAGGTYKPTQGTDRTATLRLRNHLRLYGGFSGTESARSERDFSGAAVLSGEIAGAASHEDNSFHVVTGSGCDATAVLDGFTITRGYANGAPQPLGGGVFNHTGSPVLANLIFVDNIADHGGALANYLFSAPLVVNAVFRNNATIANAGGAVYNVASNAVFTNITFEGNTASGGGSAMFNSSSNPVITNTIAWGNSGSTIGNTGSNPVFDHCLIQGSGGSGGAWVSSFGIDGGGNIDTDPLFIDAPTGDLHIALTSPAVDAGNVSAPNLPVIDIEGNARVIGAGVDMGAYESDALVGIGDGPAWTTQFHAYPNPFNPTVTLAYSISRRDDARIDVYDVKGRLVRNLLHETKGTGAHTVRWDGRDNRGIDVSSGVYFVRFTAAGNVIARKITLLK